MILSLTRSKSLPPNEKTPERMIVMLQQQKADVKDENETSLVDLDEATLSAGEKAVVENFKNLILSKTAK